MPCFPALPNAQFTVPTTSPMNRTARCSILAPRPVRSTAVMASSDTPAGDSNQHADRFLPGSCQASARVTGPAVQELHVL